MTRLSAYILLLSFFLLAACNEEKKEFMTPKPDEPVLDVNVDEYSLNGTVLGKTATDISAFDDVYDKPLYKEICDSRVKAQEEGKKNNQPADDFFSAKLHVDENLSYGDFYKSLASMRSCGYASYKLTIGSNYKDVFRLNYPICTNLMLNSCASFISEMKSLRLKELSNRQKLLLEEMLDKDVEERKSQIECVKDYTPLDLMLYYYHENDGCAYLVSLNETNLNNDSLFQGYKYYTFYNEIDLWKFIENLRSKIKPQINDRPNKRPALLDGRSEIELVFEKDIPMKDITPIIKKLNGYGYRINFSVVPSN